MAASPALWIGKKGPLTDSGLRQVLERTSLEQIVEDRLPPQVTSLSEDPRSWTSVWPPPVG